LQAAFKKALGKEGAKMFSMKDYLLHGFFCSKCFNIIDGHLHGVVRECDNCKNVTVVRRVKEKEKA
jgi:hypothetical protein